MKIQNKFAIYFILVLFSINFLLFLNNTKKDNFYFRINNNPIKKTNNTSHSISLNMPQQSKSVHSSTIIKIKNNIIVAYFAGSREGAKDVAIYANKIHNFQSSKAILLLDRYKLMQDSNEYIKKLGNPLFVKINEKVYLFVVGVSIGGWSTSKIYLYEINEDLTLNYKNKLLLSPFANLSNLIRTKASIVNFSNNKNGFILPIYHELAKKFPINLLFDENANLLNISLINNFYNLLQPALMPINNTNCLIAFRNSHSQNNKLKLQKCNNHFNYEHIIDTNLENNDDSLNLFKIKNKIFLINNKGFINSRQKLNLYELNDNEFKKISTLDFTLLETGEVSYPSNYVDYDDEMVYISYTKDRKNIIFKALSFSYFIKDE